MNRIIAVSLLSVSLAACNGSNLAGKPAGTITQANSQQVASGVSATVTGNSPTTGSGGQTTHAMHAHGRSQVRTASVRRGADSGFDPSCYTQSGDVYTLTNCLYAADGWTEVWNGTETVSYTDQSDWSDTYTLMVVSSDGQGDAENDALTGAQNSSLAGNVYTYAENDGDDFTGVYQGDSFAGNYADNLTWVFTASATDPNSGSETVAGTWSETYTDASGTQSVSTVVSTPTALTIDSTCDTGVVAGEILAVSGSSSVSMTWNGCDQETDVYSGPQGGS